MEKIFRGIELDYDNNSGIVTMESTDIAKKLVLLDGIILLGHTLRFSAYIENKTNNIENATRNNQALANSAHISAKSAAVAYAALQSLSINTNSANTNTSTDLAKHGQFTNISLNTNLSYVSPSTTTIKVMNICDSKEVEKYKPEKFEEVKEDITEEFKKYGNIIELIIINKAKYVKIGVELGSIFIKYEHSKSAEQAINSMRGRRYDNRDIKISYIDEKIFDNELKPKK